MSNTWNDFKFPVTFEIGTMTLTVPLGIVMTIWVLFLFNTLLWGIVGLIEVVGYFLGLFF